jgi:CheY-specific phosphatase CheX
MVLEWEPVLKDVISEVIETMFFSVVEFQDCRQGDRSFDYESEIELHNHQGRTVISLQLSEEFARTITAGFLGIEEDQVKDEDLLDSIKELINMVGGGYHARIEDVGRQLGIPRVWKIGPNRTHGAQGAVRLDFSFFEEPAGSVVLSYLPG